MSRFRGEYIADRKELHNAVRAEAGNRCVRCGHPGGDKLGTKGERIEVIHGVEFPVAKYAHVLMPCTEHCSHTEDGKLRILTVHHLDGHKANNAWWNLLALCQVCHLQIQGKVIPEQPYLWPHTNWFKPYVCGFYAHYYGGEAITREQADATPDRWLAMGQPWLYGIAYP